MNILISDSWLREYLKTDATPEKLMETLSLCGPSVERINSVDGDFVYDIEITTNRIDMASILGIAREAAAILPQFQIKSSFIPPQFKTPRKPKSVFPITIEDPDQVCDRLLAIVIDHVKVGPSPDSIKDRLEKSGVRSLNNLIDITNYVMLEIGHPCHVFDYDRLKTKKLLLRKAKKGETLITLDNKKCNLEEQDVVIDDGNGKIIDLPGIMGTKNSVVTGDTKRVLFFIESNNPVSIRKTSMRLSLRSMAASLNEKHPSPETAYQALLRGTELFETIAKGAVASEIVDIYPKKNTPKTILITPQFIIDRLGVPISTHEIISILSSLTFTVVKQKDALAITPPHYRVFDVCIPEDIVEEVARMYGYHNLPPQIMTGSIPVPLKIPDFAVERSMKQFLKYTGFIETYSYSFVSKDMLLKSNLDPKNHLRLSNPLSTDIEYMRTTLIPSILEVAKNNQSIVSHLNLFELAKIYHQSSDSLPDEESMLVLLSSQDFFHLKGIIENLMIELGIGSYEERPSENLFLHPHKSLSFVRGGRELGSLGVVHPKVEGDFQLHIPCTLAYFSVRALVSLASQNKKYVPISKYPEATEQLSLLIPHTIQLGKVLAQMKKEVPYIVQIDLLERFSDSITLKITYQDQSKSLTSDDIAAFRKSVLHLLESKYNIRLKL